jgi:alpha-beta hydrolase superfamily lysophospholipase
MMSRASCVLGGLISTLVLTLGFSTSCVNTAPAKETSVQAPNWKPDNLEFRSYYGWDDTVGSWRMEQIRNAGGGLVAVHIFRPPLFKWKKGTVFLLHGYLEHTGMRVPLALELVKKGWIVVGMDLPGHGLSTGARVEIQDFSEYLAAFEATMAARFWPRPWRAVGHSTGGATILMAMQKPFRKFDLVVLEAPLIRTFMWEPFLWIKNLTESWIPTVPRRAGTHDEEDPFFIDEVPLHWFDAAELYYQTTLNWMPVKGRVLLLQGEADTVVDVKYNIPFLEKILLDAEVIMIEGGKHQLLLDKSPAGETARQELFSRW